MGSAWFDERQAGTRFAGLSASVEYVVGHFEIWAKTARPLPRVRYKAVNLPVEVAGPPSVSWGWLPPSPQPSPSREREQDEPPRRTQIPGWRGARKTPHTNPLPEETSVKPWRLVARKTLTLTLSQGEREKERPRFRGRGGVRQRSPEGEGERAALLVRSRRGFAKVFPLGECEEPERLRERGCVAQGSQAREENDGRLGVRGMINVSHVWGV